MHPFYEKKHPTIQLGFSENIQFPAHLHSDIELYFVREGKTVMEIKNRQYTLEKGDCALVFPEEVHRYHSEVPGKGVLLIFSPTVTGTFFHSFQKYRPENPFLPAKQIPADVSLALERLTAANPQTEFPLCCAWIQVILANLFPLFTLTEKSGSEETDLAFRIIQYVALHFSEPLSLELLAKELNVNKFYLSHTISDRLQMNFREYLNEIRLDHALHLIRSSDLSLTQIWGDCGFESQSSFNRVFRRKTQMTPSKYRKSHTPHA